MKRMPRRKDVVQMAALERSVGSAPAAQDAPRQKDPRSHLGTRQGRGSLILTRCRLPSGAARSQ